MVRRAASRPAGPLLGPWCLPRRHACRPASSVPTAAVAHRPGAPAGDVRLARRRPRLVRRPAAGGRAALRAQPPVVCSGGQPRPRLLRGALIGSGYKRGQLHACDQLRHQPAGGWLGGCRRTTADPRPPSPPRAAPRHPSAGVELGVGARRLPRGLAGRDVGHQHRGQRRAGEAGWGPLGAAVFGAGSCRELGCRWQGGRRSIDAPCPSALPALVLWLPGCAGPHRRRHAAGVSAPACRPPLHSPRCWRLHRRPAKTPGCRAPLHSRTRGQQSGPPCIPCCACVLPVYPLPLLRPPCALLAKRARLEWDGRPEVQPPLGATHIAASRWRVLLLVPPPADCIPRVQRHATPPPLSSAAPSPPRQGHCSWWQRHSCTLASRHSARS